MKEIIRAKTFAYRWPDLSAVTRQYIVRDDRGRYGIGVTDGADSSMWARPIGVPCQINAPANLELPSNAILMTATSWSPNADGSYRGWWSDDDIPTYPATVPPAMIRRLEIVDDLGYRMPDWVAEQALAGSAEMGAWNYGAHLGKVGGETPVTGQKHDEMTVEMAEDYAREVGATITRRAIRLAACRGDIPGARKVGRDWLLSYDGINHFLDNRPSRGPKSRAQTRAVAVEKELNR